MAGGDLEHPGAEADKGWRLPLYMVRQPLWLLGWGAAAGTFIFPARTLYNGPMSVVQPVLVSSGRKRLTLRASPLGTGPADFPAVPGALR